MAVVLALGALWPAGAASAAAIPLNPARQPLPLQEAAEAWFDASGSTGIEQVAGNGGLPWQPLAANGIHRLTRGTALWVRFTVQAGANPLGLRWYLEIPYAATDRATLYTLTAPDQWSAVAAGDLLPVAQWPVPNRHPLLPLAIGSGELRTWYLRIESSHGFSAPLQLVTGSYWIPGEQRVVLMLGFLFGLMALTLMLAAVSAITLRDQAFGLFALTVAAMGLTQAGMTGLGGMHLWPHQPWWNDVSRFVFPVLAAGCMHAFVATVVSLRERAPRLYWALIGLALLAVPVAAGLMAVEPSMRYRLMLPYLMASIPVMIATLVWALGRGDRHAGWVLAANLPVALAAALPLARAAGLIATSAWTQHALQFAVAIELPVLLVVLMHRSQMRRDHARRMQGLDRFDPATGLLNAAVFRERLVRLIARSVRLKYRSAILMVEITNLEQIRRQFNRAAAEELPLRVAGRLLSASREIDSVARLSEHRFGLLLEGPLKADEVAEAAPRVVARCLMPFRNKPLEWAAQVRVAQALIPKDGTDPDHLIGQLEALLAAASPDGKRTVFMVSKPNLPAPMPLTPSTY